MKCCAFVVEVVEIKVDLVYVVMALIAPQFDFRSQAVVNVAASDSRLTNSDRGGSCIEAKLSILIDDFLMALKKQLFLFLLESGVCFEHMR